MIPIQYDTLKRHRPDISLRYTVLALTQVNMLKMSQYKLLLLYAGRTIDEWIFCRHGTSFSFYADYFPFLHHVNLYWCFPFFTSFLFALLHSLSITSGTEPILFFCRLNLVIKEKKKFIKDTIFLENLL